MHTTSFNIEQGGTLAVSKSHFSSAAEAELLINKWLQESITVETTSGALVDTDWNFRDVTPLDSSEVDSEYYGFLVLTESDVEIKTSEPIEYPDDFGYENLCISFEQCSLPCQFSVKHTEIIPL